MSKDQVYEGVVKWFSNAKGYGFIQPDRSTRDIFAHWSSIKMEGYKTLRSGDRVSFCLVDGPKGPNAVEIQAIDQ